MDTGRTGRRARRADGLERDLLRERARAGIREAIASGELKPGDQIVEAAIAARIGVSRSPVREALRELEQHGLVESLPNRGTFVAALTAEDVEEIVLLRGALEGLAARLAADRMGRRDLRALEEIVERMAYHTGLGPQEESAFTEDDAEFHSTLVRLSGHRRLQRLWLALDPLIWLLTVNDARESGRRDRDAMAREHRELLDTLAAGDPEAAQRAVWEHIVRRLPALPVQWPPASGPGAASMKRSGAVI
ncbi:MAG: GntR family transcriptional regulator [Chloroflexi bacterium]|nr:GntR family transcriptional regulator [Chloroflexota bacterium]